MDKIKVELEVAKETYELGQGLGKFALSVRDALKDGWQFGEDLPEIMTSALGDLVPAVQGAEKIAEEVKDIEPFVDAVYCGLKPTVMGFIKKSEEAAAE